MTERDLTLPISVIARIKNADLSRIEKGMFVKAEAELIWQYIRFNKKYQRQHDNIEAECKRDTESCEQLKTELCQQWGISEALNYQAAEIPVGFSIQKIPVSYVDFEHERDDENSERSLSSSIFAVRQYQPKHPNYGPIVFIVDRTADRRVILSAIDRILKNDVQDRFVNRENPVRLKASAARNIVGNVLCYYFKEVRRFSTAQVSKELAKCLQENVALQPHSLNKRINTFKKWSQDAPWIFFNSPG